MCDRLLVEEEGLVAALNSMRSLAEYPFLTPGSRALVTALGERDRYTESHSRRVVGFCDLIGRACHLLSEELKILNISALFHDIGKIGIPDAVLLKPARFNTQDMAVMKDHPVKGETIIRALGLESGAAIAQAVRHHHEHYDGSGYPDGLRGEAIPYLSRLVAVADSYDAMTKSRPYHPARPVTETLDIMQGESGSKLDPYLVNKLRQLASSWPDQPLE